MIVSEIIGESRDVLGKCPNDYVFKRITDAVRLANNQAAGNDWNVAIMDLCVCDGCLTLPADVGTILAINNGGMPTLLRDQWYQYHANGSGSDCCVPCGYSDELGPASTFRDPSEPVNLVAVVENALDSNLTLRVFGWDVNGKRIYTEGASGVLEDGFLVPMVYGFPTPNPAAPAILRIDRVQKAVTNGFVKLIALNASDGDPNTTIGYYQPWETTPSYRRIRVPDRSYIRIKYRKKDLEVRGLTDWINIDNREALLLLLKAVKMRLDNQLEQARGFENEAMRLLSNEASTLRPPANIGPQIVFNEGLPAGQWDTMFY